MKRDNLIVKKSYAFALEIIYLSRLISNKREYVISKQILRSGTSIGANVEEAMGASSKKDFAQKIQISYREARETLYWLRLLKDSKLITESELGNLLLDCEELIRILGSIRVTTLKYLDS